MKLPKLTALEAISSDGKGTITFKFNSDNGRSHYVPITVEAMNALLPAIVSVSNELLSSDGKTLGMQPATLTQMRPFVFEDGDGGLDLWIDGVPIRLSLHPKQLAPLRNALAELERMTSATPRGGLQ